MSGARFAGLVGGAVRRHMATKGWEWRFGPLPRDAVDLAAVGRLRDDMARCVRWVEIAATAIGMSMPIGNGSGGPWHRQAVLDAAGRFGVADIAAGRIAWTDAVVPGYVKRFALSVDMVESPNLAGGHGAMGSATHQIAAVYGSQPVTRVRISPTPKPIVTSIEWGLTTCYSTTGVAPAGDEYRDEWAALILAGIPARETAVPQWDRAQPAGWHCTVEIAELVLALLPYPTRRAVRIRKGGVDHFGCKGEAEFQVFGFAAEREKRREILRAAWNAVAAYHVHLAMLTARRDAGLPTTQRERDEIRWPEANRASAVRDALGAL